MAYERKTVDILISDEIKEILKSIESQSVVASLLLTKRHKRNNLVEDYVDYISISSQDPGRISYLSKDRIKLLSDHGVDLWNNPKRYHAKPGAFVSKIFKDISPVEIEKFSNLFRSESVKIEFDFKVVDGEDIKSYYHYEIYKSDRGSLGQSCMKHDESQKLLNIYSKNNDMIKMLVMLDKRGYLMGRALLWIFDSHKIMDRIYTIDDEKLQHHFKKWATDSGYLYKSEQNWYNTLYFENLKSKKIELPLKIELINRNDFSRYPYMDTFKFMDINDGTLYNYIPEDKNLHILCATDGSRYGIDHLRFDSIDRIFRYRGECVYIDYKNIWTGERNTKWSSSNDKYILNNDCVYDEEIGDYLFKSDMDEMNNKERIEFFKKNAKNKLGVKRDYSILEHIRSISNDIYLEDGVYLDLQETSQEF